MVKNKIIGFALVFGAVVSFGSNTAMFGKIKDFERGCDYGNSDMCFYASEYYLRANNKQKAELYIKKGEDALEKMCRKSDAYSCYTLAQKTKDIEKAKTFFQKAHNLFSIACENKNSDACRVLSEYAFGDIETSSRVKDNILSMLEDGCKGNNADSCISLGDFYKEEKGDRSSQREMQESYNKALEIYKKGCKAKNVASCEILGYIYLSGSRVPQNKTMSDIYYKEALHLNKKACDINIASGCESLGNIYLGGKGTEKSLEKAVESYRKACKLGLTSSCEWITSPSDKEKKSIKRLKSN